MNHSLLIPSPSSLITYRSSPPRQLNFSQSELMNPPPLLRSPISVIRTEVVAQQSNPINSGIFGPKKELTGIQLLAEALSPWPRVRLASSVAMVAGALAGGYEVGSTLNFVSGAVAPGAAGGLVIRKLNSCVSEVAAVNLHNFVASSDDPESLKREDIEAIAKKFENLKGNQREIVMKFKNALGILDLDAAVEEIVVVRDAIAIASGVHEYERDIKAFVKIVAAQDPNRLLRGYPQETLQPMMDAHHMESRDVFDPSSPNRSVSQVLNLMDQFTDNPFLAASRGMGAGKRGWDAREDENGLYVRVDMPGLGKEDVNVSVEHNTLIIKGEGDKETDDTERKRRYTSRINLLEKLYKIDQIKAEMKNGVLRVTVPKVKEEENKDVVQVQIE